MKAAYAGYRISRLPLDAAAALQSVTWFIAVLSLFLIQFIQTMSAAVFMGASVAYMMARPGMAIRATSQYAIPWLYTALAVASVMWSEQPALTIRGAVQFAFTTGTALVMSGALAPRSLMTVYLLAILSADLASVLNPRMALNQGALAMIGVFGSKNSFGLTQALLVMFGIWVALDREQRAAIRSLGFVGAVGGSILLLAARSLDAIVGVAGALCCSMLPFGLVWFPPRWRMLCLIFGGTVLIIVSTFAMLFSADIFYLALSLTGKSTSLTDRTPLWAVAEKMIQERPIFGMGYEAFWVEGNQFAENLWMRFNPSRFGYHFHNLWYECAVDLGYVGLVVAFVTVLATTIEVVRWTVRAPSAVSCFFLGYTVFTIMRSVLEVDLFWQFSFTWVLFVATWAYARRDRAQSKMYIR
jgi:exopolysaccharide production protein ExoQ